MKKGIVLIAACFFVVSYTTYATTAKPVHAKASAKTVKMVQAKKRLKHCYMTQCKKNKKGKKICKKIYKCHSTLKK